MHSAGMLLSHFSSFFWACFYTLDMQKVKLLEGSFGLNSGLLNRELQHWLHGVVLVGNEWQRDKVLVAVGVGTPGCSVQALP